MKQYAIGIDIGSTYAKAIVLDAERRCRGGGAEALLAKRETP